jgi:hypothetical protein
MTMAKRKKDDPLRPVPRRHGTETTRLLEERIAYHRAKLSEERERAERPRRLRFWRYWRTET